MNVIFGEGQREQLADKYITLRLDTIGVKGKTDPTQIYAIVGAESIPLGDMPTLHKSVELHEKFVDNYRNQNFDYCNQALEHLVGQFGGEIDSYYAIMAARIHELKVQGIPDDWDWIEWQDD